MTTYPLRSISVFFPVFNEAENIDQLLSTSLSYIPSLARQYEIIIVNDGSTDETASKVREWIKKDNHIRLVSHKKNKGYGAALKTGITTCRYEWIFWTDGDLQFDLQSLNAFLSFTKSSNAMLGYRAHRADTLLRKINGQLYTMLINVLFRINVRDIDCAFKLIHADELRSILITTSSAFTSAEILIRLKRQGVKFKQIPVTHFPRQRGKPTGGSLRVIFFGMRQALTFYLQNSFLTPVKE